MKALRVFAICFFLVTAALAPPALAGATSGDAAESPTSTDQTPATDASSSADHDRVADETSIAPAASSGGESSGGTSSESRTNALTEYPSLQNNTTAKLPLTAVSAANYSTPRLDFAATMAFDASEVDRQYHVAFVTHQLDAATSQSASDAIVEAYLDAVTAELDALATAEREAVQRYAAGESDADTLLVELAVVDRRARAIDNALTRIRFESPGLSRSVLNRIENVRLELRSFQTPVREHVALAVTGDLDGDPNPLHVQAGPDGVVVEMLDGTTYHRNAIRFDNRDVGAVDQLGGLGAFQDRIEERYPWSYANRQDIAIDAYTQRNLYTATYGHPQGTMTTYVDGGTADVYREHQTLITTRLPVTERSTTTANNVSVTVVRTPDGGPIRVNVTNAATGEPIDARIDVNGETVGRSGDDGELWWLATTTPFDVTVATAGVSINVTVG
jgi:hypothetical protein